MPGLDNLNSFSRRLSKAITDGTNRLKIEAALIADSTAVVRTPVRTGRLRANWRVGIGQENNLSNNETDSSSNGAPTISRNERDIMAADPGKAIYLSNNVVYALAVDMGSSAGAPQGMSGPAAEAAREHIRRNNIIRTGDL